MEGTCLKCEKSLEFFFRVNPQFSRGAIFLAPRENCGFTPVTIFFSSSVSLNKWGGRASTPPECEIRGVIQGRKGTPGFNAALPTDVYSRTLLGAS